MKNKIKKSITYKIFAITSMLLIVSAVFTYLILYFMLPKFYLQYKKTSLEKGLNSLTSKVQNLTFNESKGSFDKFNSKYNVTLSIIDSNGYIVYAPIIRLINSSAITQAIDVAPLENQVRIYMDNTNTAINNNNNDEFSEVYTALRTITFIDDPNIYTVYITAPMQPIDEATKVLFIFMPYIGLIVLVTSLSGAFIYSKIISQPLLTINKVAKQMADLDFKNQCEVFGEDEIGELSLSLNQLSTNLQTTMNELKDVNIKLLDDIEKEREIEKRRREFTATISHELKTPITIVKGQLEGMLENIGVYKDRDKYLNRSLEVLQEMEIMVREVLEISKLEAHSFKPTLTLINLSDTIKKCTDNLTYIALDKNIETILNIEEELHIEADERLIKKAVSNIINNGISHSNKGEKVYINAYKQNDNIKIEVENTGVHIDEKEFSQLFNPFYRIEKSRSRNTGGSGLGLYIVKMILEAHKVQYNIYNTKLGVKFDITF